MEFDDDNNNNNNNNNPIPIIPFGAGGDNVSIASAGIRDRVAILEGGILELRDIMQVLLQRLPPPQNDPPPPPRDPAPFPPAYVGDPPPFIGPLENPAVVQAREARRGAALELPQLGEEEEAKVDPHVEPPGLAQIREQQRLAAERLEAHMAAQQRLAAEQRQEQADVLRRIEDQRIEERAMLQQLLAQFAPGRAPPEPPDPEPGQGQNRGRDRNHNNRGNNNAPREARRSSMSQFLEDAEQIPALAVQEFVPHPKVPATFKEVEVGPVCMVFEEIAIVQGQHKGIRIRAASALEYPVAEEIGLFKSQVPYAVELSVAQVMDLSNPQLYHRCAMILAPQSGHLFFEALKANIPDRIPALDTHRYGPSTLTGLITHLRAYRTTFTIVYEFLALYARSLPPCTYKQNEGLIWLFARPLLQPWFENVDSHVRASAEGPFDNILLYIDAFFADLGKEKHIANNYKVYEYRNDKANECRKTIASTSITVTDQHRSLRSASVHNIEQGQDADDEERSSSVVPFKTAIPATPSAVHDHLPALVQALQGINDKLDKQIASPARSRSPARSNYIAPNTYYCQPINTYAQSGAEECTLEQLANSPDNFTWCFKPPCHCPEEDPDAHGYALCQIVGESRVPKFVPVCRYELKYGDCPRKGKGCKWSHEPEDLRQFCFNCEQMMRYCPYSSYYDPTTTRPKPPPERSSNRDRQQRYNGHPPYRDHDRGPRGDPPRSGSHIQSSNHPTTLQRPQGGSTSVSDHRLQAVSQQAADGRAAEAKEPRESSDDKKFWANWDPAKEADTRR